MDLEIVDGFYGVESDSTNSWYWAYNNEVTISIKNGDASPQSVCLEFNAIPPLGMNKRKFYVSCEQFEIENLAPCTFRRIIRLQGNQKIIIKIQIPGDAVYVDNGDKRPFMLMVQNIALKQVVENSTNLHEVQKVEIALLSKVVSICNKYDLHCYLFYGSLLGSVRDGGIIPWDDDVDIVLLREDYDKLIHYLQTELEWPYLLQTPDNTFDAFYGGYCKLRNISTTGVAIEADFNKLSNQGIWIDIFPLDNLISDYRVRKHQLRKIHNLQASIKRNISSFFMLKKHLYFLKKLNKNFMLGDEKEEYVTVLARFLNDEMRHFYPKSIFDGKVYMEFEGLKINVPSDYKLCLSTEYGNNYNSIPDERERIPRHNAIYRVDVPWDVYSQKLITKKNIKKKSIVLMCNEFMLDKFFDTYRKVNVKYIVDNDRAGRFYKGIMIISVDQLSLIMSEELFIVIFDEDYIGCEHELSSLNLTNYGIMICNEIMQKCERKYMCMNAEK